MNPRTKNFLSICIKIIIIGLALSYIFKKLNNNQSIDDFRMLLNDLSVKRVWFVLSVVTLLMFLNWFLESLKWRYLVRRIENISIWKAVESVFCGLTWAIFTPNRIGEYGGRVLFLSPRKRIIGVVAMSIGSFGQLVVTNVIGALALFWFLSNFMNLNPFLLFGIGFLIFIFCGFFLLFYFNIHWIDGLLSRIKFIRRYKRFFGIFSRYNVSELFKVVIYCVLRYLVFTTQYYLVIHLLIPDIRVLDMVMFLFILYFIQSALPSIDLFNVGVRVGTASYLFAFITDHDLAIMASFAFIWVLNLIIPAILGSVFVLKLKFFDNSSN